VISIQLGAAQQLLKGTVVFRQPVLLNLTATLPAGASADELVVAYIDESDPSNPHWVTLSSASTVIVYLGGSRYSVVASVNHFTSYVARTHARECQTAFD